MPVTPILALLMRARERSDSISARLNDSLAALLARGDRQTALLQRSERAPGTGDRVTATVEGLRELADHVTSMARHRHYRAAAGDMLDTADISATDPVAALDVGGELIAPDLLYQTVGADAFGVHGQ